jgi:transposase
MEQNEQKSEKKTRRRFDEQFKSDAVKLPLESGRTTGEVAKELGVGHSELRRWKKQFAHAGGTAAVAFPGNGKARVENKEMDELRKELARVKEEREILKKAMAVFSRRP